MALLVQPLAALAQTAWQAIERVETYAISGGSGMELYMSIGDRGPKLGGEASAIAHTSFKLTWKRDYRPQPGGGCTLVSAKPNLIITYTLPKPGALSPDVQRKWDAFLAGIRRHEGVHGVQIIEMVREIERVSVGLNAANDPKCEKVRAALQSKLGPISDERRKKSRDFDKAEMSNGGNVHQLIRALVDPKPAM